MSKISVKRVNGRTVNLPLTKAHQAIKEDLTLLSEQIEDLVKSNIPQNGNASWECQRITLLNALCEFQYAINGIEPEDLTEKEDE